MNIYKESILPNNLKVITSENPNSDIVTISFWAKAGGRNGIDEQRGYAHILEHMLMKGCKKYPSIFDISVVKDRVGAASNAFAGPERIFLFIQVAKNHLEKMFELLADSVLNPIIDSNVLENEKRVIIQEFNRAMDNHARRLWKLSMSTAFKNHPLSRDVLGDEKSISSANSEKIKEFYRQYIFPNISAIIVSGGVSHDKIVFLAQEFFGGWKKNEAIDDSAVIEASEEKTAFDFMTSKQTHLSFNFIGPKPDFKEAILLKILEIFLGYGQSSIFYQELRHKKGLVYTIAVNNTIYKDANLFFMSTSTTQPKEALNIAPIIIDNIENYLSEQIFEEIKEQTIGIFLRLLNDPMNELDFLGSNWRFYDKLMTPNEFIAVVKESSYDEIINVKNKFLSKNNFFIAAIGEENPFKK